MRALQCTFVLLTVRNVQKETRVCVRVCVVCCTFVDVRDCDCDCDCECCARARDE